MTESETSLPFAPYSLYGSRHLLADQGDLDAAGESCPPVVLALTFHQG